jgi:hypothetical protein
MLASGGPQPLREMLEGYFCNLLMQLMVTFLKGQ